MIFKKNIWLICLRWDTNGLMSQQLSNLTHNAKSV